MTRLVLAAALLSSLFAAATARAQDAEQTAFDAGLDAFYDSESYGTVVSMVQGRVPGVPGSVTTLTFVGFHRGGCLQFRNLIRDSFDELTGLELEREEFDFDPRNGSCTLVLAEDDPTDALGWFNGFLAGAQSD